MNSLVGPSPTGEAILYARFSRRLYAMALDFIIVTVSAFAAVFVGVSIGSSDLARALGIVVVIALLLYEPLLVSFAGCTIGHRLANLRVVDDKNGGNVSFAKAVARMVLKSVLGWLSFLVITATRRSQALHDLWTRSTVQIRDPAKALTGHYLIERTELLDTKLPSRWRRIVVICGYILLAFVICVVVWMGLAITGILSRACVQFGRCTVGDDVLANGIVLAWLVTCAVCIGLGWRGKLFGARRRS